MEKGNIIELKITDMTVQGQGVGHVEGMAVFVAGGMPGDTCKAEIKKVKKSYANAVAVEIREPSPDRVEPVCPYADSCGG